MKLFVIMGTSVCWSPPLVLLHTSSQEPFSFLGTSQEPPEAHFKHPPPKGGINKILYFAEAHGALWRVSGADYINPGSRPRHVMTGKHLWIYFSEEACETNAKETKPNGPLWIHKSSRNSCRDFLDFNRYKQGRYPIPTDCRLGV